MHPEFQREGATILARIGSFRITRHRRVFETAASATVAVAVFLGGAATLSLPGVQAALPTESPGDETIQAAERPATISQDLLNLEGRADSGASRNAPHDEAPATDAAEPSGKTDGSTAGEDSPAAITDPDTASWLDEKTGRAEILLRFTDEGVPAEAEGNPEAAAALLQESAEDTFAQAERDLAKLERDGTVTVLNTSWLATTMLIEAEPSEDTITALAAIPGVVDLTPNYEVHGLESEEPVEVTETPGDSEYTDNEGNPITYGLKHLNAPDAWEFYNAYGQGVRVAVLDTGVDPNHPDLAPRLATDDPSDPLYPGGWIHLDHEGKPRAKQPADPATHGTHVAGTILGGNEFGVQIGVAPQAELMAVNAISDGSSSFKILKALEWTMDPYDAEGKRAGRPADVINMSLGNADKKFTDTYLFGTLQKIRAAGIFPAIASGNDMKEGSECISNPSSSYDAFAVGMSTEDRSINSRSCGGTTHWSESIVKEFGWPSGEFIRPDVAAPGTDIISSVPGGGWGKSTGTSMATPHVAGAVAALRSAQPGLSVDEIATALEETAWHPDKTAESVFAPDIRFGHGIINLHDAIALVRGESGFSLTITDAVTGDPVSGAQVSWATDHKPIGKRENAEYGETWSTDESGTVTSYLPPGSYTLTVDRFGYEQQTVATSVTEGSFVELETQLSPKVTGSVAGAVTDASTGKPLPGVTVALAGHDLKTLTDDRGAYTLAGVPVGETHRLRASLEGMHTETVSDITVTNHDEPTRLDFQLNALPHVLVLGDATGRSAQLLATQELVVDSADVLPEPLETLTDYDVVVWDDPGKVSREKITKAIEVTDKAGTGIVWLDLGSSDTSGLAVLHDTFASPKKRTTQTDETVYSIGYQIIKQPDHPLFNSGSIFTGSLINRSLITQDANPTSDSFWASFEELQSKTAVVLADTVTLVEGDSAKFQKARGAGIAVDERAGNRHVYLALHASHAAVDARTWSAEGKQVFANAVTWAASSKVNTPSPKPKPKPEVPVPPVVTPGDGGSRVPTTTAPNPTSPKPGANAPGAVQLPPLANQQQGAQQQAAKKGGAAGSLRAPSAQATPKPEKKPEPPVAAENLLTKANAGGITMRLEEGIAHITIPDSKPGDWFFLHVYPSKTPVDWIRVNDDGELRVDISSLSDGEYQFAFTSSDEQFVGWVTLQLGEPVAEEAEQEEHTDPATIVPATIPPAGFSLSTTELLMLLGAAVLLLGAAGVVLFGLRKPAVPEP